MNKIEVFVLDAKNKSEKIFTKDGAIYATRAFDLSIDEINKIINTNCEHYYSNITTNFRGNRCLNVYPYENGNFGELEAIGDILFYSNIQETQYSINK